MKQNYRDMVEDKSRQKQAASLEKPTLNPENGGTTGEVSRMTSQMNRTAFAALVPNSVGKVHCLLEEAYLTASYYKYRNQREKRTLLT